MCGARVPVFWVCGRISFAKFPSGVPMPSTGADRKEAIFQGTGSQGHCRTGRSGFLELAMRRAGHPCVVALEFLCLPWTDLCVWRNSPGLSSFLFLQCQNGMMFALCFGDAFQCLEDE